MRNPFGQNTYNPRITCRTIFTDPNNHQELHDQHVKNFNNYYGYWYQDDLYAYDARTQAILQNGLKSIEGVKIHGSSSLEDRMPVCSFTVHDQDPAETGTRLDVDYEIATRTGLHCAPLIHEHLGTSPNGTVRMSVGPMNEKADVEAAVKAVAEIAAE